MSAGKRFPVSLAGTKRIEAALALPEAKRWLPSVPREPERTLRGAWDAEAMARAEALEHPDPTPALDAEDTVNVLEKQLRHPRPR